MSISPWYPQSPPWWTHWQLSRKCSFEVWKRVYSQFSHKGTTWSISKRKQWKWPSWHQNSISKWDKAKEGMETSNSRKESKISLKVHMKEQLFIWPLIIVRIQELQFKFRNDNKIIRMQIWYSPSLWSSFFQKFSFFSYSPKSSPFHIFTNSSPPLTMESSRNHDLLLSREWQMQIEKEA